MIVDRLSATPAAPHPADAVDAGRAAAAAAVRRAAATSVAGTETEGFAAKLAGPSVPAPEIGRVHGIVRHEARRVSPEEKFEAFVLRSFVEQMLPSEEGGFFGDGMAGNVWRSMLAEQIGDELAASGGVGIADMLEKRDARLPAALPDGPDPASLAGSLGAAGMGAALSDDADTEL